MQNANQVPILLTVAIQKCLLVWQTVAVQKMLDVHQNCKISNPFFQHLLLNIHEEACQTGYPVQEKHEKNCLDHFGLICGQNSFLRAAISVTDGFYCPFNKILPVLNPSFIKSGQKPDYVEKKNLTFHKQNLIFSLMT